VTGNYQRTPLGDSFSRIGREAAATALQQSAKALPCTVVSVNGQFVTVKFETNAGPFTLPNITIPINTSQYDWLPIQAGDPGYTQPADIALAHISGVSDSLPNLVQSGNLTGLAFQPIAKKQYTAANSNQRVVQGPAGVLLQDMGANTTLNLTPSTIALSATSSVTVSGGTTITVQVGGISIVINASGVAITGNLTVSGNINTTGGVVQKAGVPYTFP
jgi:hypothetical protein